MKRKSTNIGFSATILNLINKKVITYKKDQKNDDIILNLVDENYIGTKAEIIVLNVLFNMVGEGNRCNIKSLKNYGKTTYKARSLIKKIDKLKKRNEQRSRKKRIFQSKCNICFV